MKDSSATISWDVSGYYFYLPSAFIYKDIKGLKFKDELLAKYKPQPGFVQAYIHEESGNYVMKYSIGQSVVYSPFFFVAHAWASTSDKYPADGFSLPYQFMISMGMLLWTIIGLIYIRKALLHYFDENVTALGILGVLLGSNYLNYTAIDGAMTHNTVFTIYAVLIYLSIQFHKNPSWLKAIGIGGCVGLASLIRPTEIISCLIPILWGVSMFNRESLARQVAFLGKQIPKLLIAIFITAAIGFIQLAYWKYATGDWIVYSYQDQGFSWFKPHLFKGIFSYRTGWLVYSPFMIFSLLGYFALYKRKKEIFYATFIFSVLFIYIAFAWDIWWYGGSLGQRTMVQAYPILMFPLCAFIQAVLDSKTKWIKGLIAAFAVLFIYANLWFTHQAHYGGIVKVSQMTKAYFWKTLFTYKINPQNLKLLDDCKELFEGVRENVQTIYADKEYHSTLDTDHQYGEKISIAVPNSVNDYDWVRISADVFFEHKEWTNWMMTQFVVNLKDDDKHVKHRMFRVQRVFEANKWHQAFLDIRKPDYPFSEIEIIFWNGGGHKEFEVKNVLVEGYFE